MDEQIQLSSIVGNDAILDIDVQGTESSYIKVVGVGGAGTNAVNHMFNKGINGVDLFVCNTDATCLNASPVKNKISIGKLGAGGNPAKGRQAAEESQEDIKQIFDPNTRMLFVTAGMGGGTGTGASPVVAKLAKDVVLPEEEEKILVVGVVTLPFSFEGRKRRKQAEEGIAALKEHVDCMIIVNTDKLRDRKDLPLTTAFALADDILFTAVKGISEIMTSTGYVQVDFRDVQSVMKDSGVALMGMGIAEGENRALEAIKAATTSELLNDNDISKTKNMLLTFTCSNDAVITMDEISTIVDYLADQTCDEVDVIWGLTKDDSLGDKLSITLIATGFEYKDIYTPTTRKAVEKVSLPTSIPAPDASTNSIPDNIIEIATKELEKAKSNKGMEEIVMVNKPTAEVQEPVATPSVSVKTIIHVDENVNPIVPKSETNTQSGVSAEQNKDSVYEDIHLVQPTAFRQVEPQQMEEPKAVKTETEVATIAPQPIEQPATVGLRDAIGGGFSDEVTGRNINTDIAEKDFANRYERIKKIREQMNTPGGLEQIINSHPTPENNFDFVDAFSSPKSQSTLSVNNSGNIEMRSNFAIDSQVD